MRRTGDTFRIATSVSDQNECSHMRHPLRGSANLCDGCGAVLRVLSRLEAAYLVNEAVDLSVFCKPRLYPLDRGKLTYIDIELFPVAYTVDDRVKACARHSQL